MSISSEHVSILSILLWYVNRCHKCVVKVISVVVLMVLVRRYFWNDLTKVSCVEKDKRRSEKLLRCLFNLEYRNPPKEMVDFFRSVRVEKVRQCLCQLMRDRYGPLRKGLIWYTVLQSSFVGSGDSGRRTDF